MRDDHVLHRRGIDAEQFQALSGRAQEFPFALRRRRFVEPRIDYISALGVAQSETK